MTSEPDSALREASGQRRRNVRALLLLPPFVLVLASGVLLASSPLAWGAAAVLDVPDWVPAAIGAVVGLAGLWIGLYSLRQTARYTQGDFEIFGLQLVLGVIMFVAGSGIMLTLALQLPDPDLYARTIQDDGDTAIGAVEIVVVSLFTGGLSIGVVWVGAYLYSHAFANMEPNRISQRLPGEVDGVGELLRDRR